MKTKTIFIILLILSVKITLGQDNQDFKQTIRGIVVDKVTQMTLPGVNIVLQGTSPVIGTTTDMSGDFKIENIDVGHHTLYISYIGYEPRTVSIELTTGRETVLNIKLEEQAFTLDVVTVIANERKDETINKMATVSTMKFNVEESQHYAGTMNDAARMVSSFAGIASNPSGVNDIIVRGNSPRGLLWRLEGIDIPNPNHFAEEGSSGGGISILNGAVLDNSDFFTGAFPAEYGNAYSGIFDMALRNGNNQKREYSLQAGFVGVDCTLEGPFHKKNPASYLFNYRYSTLAMIRAIGITMSSPSF
jgi:hypothetical protein